MEKITNLGSTEVSTGRGQGPGLPPAAITGAIVGEHLSDVKVATGVATCYQKDLASNAVIKDRELAALP